MNEMNAICFSFVTVLWQLNAYYFIMTRGHTRKSEEATLFDRPHTFFISLVFMLFKSKYASKATRNIIDLSFGNLIIRFLSLLPPAL